MSLLGQRLRQERDTRGLGLPQIEIETRIRASLIQALEDGHLDSLPPEPFLRGLIRSYANYLRVDPQELLDLYSSDLNQPSQVTPSPNPAPVSRPKAEPYTPPPRSAIERLRADLRQSEPFPKETSLVSEEKVSLPPEEKLAPLPPISFPEPFQSQRRRLPLAPPSAKPPNPVIKSATPSPPPLIPPEILPPPEKLLSQAQTPGSSNLGPVETPSPAPKTDAGTSRQEESSVSLPSTSPAPPAQESPLGAEPAPSFANTQPLTDRSFRLLHLPISPSSIPWRAFAVGAAAIMVLVLLSLVYFILRGTPEGSATSAQRTGTATLVARPAITVDEATATAIPTLVTTAPAYTAIPAVVTQAPKPTATVRSVTQEGPLALDIDATEPITAQVGIDGVMVFNGPMAQKSSLSWVGKESLYLRVENFVGSTVTFNGRKQVPLNFGERSIYERQWVVSANGKIVYATPVAPGGTRPTPTKPAVAPSATRTETPPPTNTPKRATPTLTPFF